MEFVQKVNLDGKIKHMKQSTFSVVYRSIDPILTLCRLVGLMPIINVKKNNEVVLRSDRNDWLYFTTHLVLYFLLLMYSMKIVVNEEMILYLSKFMQVVYLLASSLSMCILTVFAFYKRSTVRDIIEHIAEVDCLFKFVDLKMSYFSRRRIILRRLSCILGLHLLRSIAFYFIQEITITQHFVLTIVFLLKCLLMFQYSTLVALLEERYVMINRAIRFYGAAKITLSEKVKFVAERLYILCRAHFRLCSAAHLINEVFGFQLVACASMSILNFLSQSYFLYILCTREVIHKTSIKAVSILLWFSEEIIELFVALYACTNTCDSANETSIALHEIQNTIENSELEKQIQIYSLQMLHQKICFSAFGFFEMDFSLFYGIMGSVLTFSVIVVQYDQTSHPNNSETGLQTIANHTTSSTTNIY